MTKSKYKYVYWNESYKAKRYGKQWQAYYKNEGRNFTRYFKTDREAAIAIDKYFLSIGKEPVNILKRKD